MEDGAFTSTRPMDQSGTAIFSYRSSCHRLSANITFMEKQIERSAGFRWADMGPSGLHSRIQNCSPPRARKAQRSSPNRRNNSMWQLDQESRCPMYLHQSSECPLTHGTGTRTAPFFWQERTWPHCRRWRSTSIAASKTTMASRREPLRYMMSCRKNMLSTNIISTLEITASHISCHTLPKYWSFIRGHLH